MHACYTYFSLFTTIRLEIILNLSHLDVHTYMHSYNTTCINLHKNTAMTATTMALNKIIVHGDISVIYKYKDHTYTSLKAILKAENGSSENT